MTGNLTFKNFQYSWLGLLKFSSILDGKVLFFVLFLGQTDHRFVIKMSSFGEEIKVMFVSEPH